MGAFPLDLKTRRHSPYSHPHFCLSVPEGQSQPAFSIAKDLSDEKKPQCFPMGVAGCQGDDQGPWESLPVPLLPINPARSQTHLQPGAAAREPSRTRCGSFGKVAAGPCWNRRHLGEGTKERSRDAGGDAGGAAVLSPDERVGCSAGNHCRSAAEGNPPPRSGSQNTLRRGKGRVDGLEITCTNTQP